MFATRIHAPGDIRYEELPDPIIKHSTDAIVKVVAACVCGSDLWGYRGVNPVNRPRPIGHEFVGIVEEVGRDVTGIRPGQFVIAPFLCSDGTCVNCLNGIPSSCVNGASWGGKDAGGEFMNGGQGEWVRVAQADGTLVATPDLPDDDAIPDLLTLSDVLGTGYHAAVSAGVTKGSTVVVVGDGAVGLCAVLAANKLGAERVVIMSRHADRQALARDFGATDIIAERGAEGVAAVKELFGGYGADAVLECVGTVESMGQALDSARHGGKLGYVGVPNGGEALSLPKMFMANIGIAGGVAPVRAYMADLLPDVLDGTIKPGKVFDQQIPLSQVAQAYADMNDRRSIKTLLRP
jgi:hypothetical protein